MWQKIGIITFLYKLGPSWISLYIYSTKADLLSINRYKVLKWRESRILNFHVRRMRYCVHIWGLYVSLNGTQTKCKLDHGVNYIMIKPQHLTDLLYDKSIAGNKDCVMKPFNWTRACMQPYWTLNERWQFFNVWKL